MTNDEQGLRKAAILIDMLDQSSADAILERLGDDAADQIRTAVLGLEPAKPAERRRILDELSGCSAGSKPSGHSDPSEQIPDKPPFAEIGHSGDAARRQQPANTPHFELSPPEPIVRRTADSMTAADPVPTLPATEPFAFLQNMPIELLSSYFEGEHPQVVSIALAHLAPDRAAQYLATLPGDRRVELLRRLAQLDVTDADVISDVERGLQTLVADRLQADQQRPLGLATLEAILDVVDDNQRREFLGHLKRFVSGSDSTADHRRATTDASEEKDAEKTPRVFHARFSTAELTQRSSNLLDALAAPVRPHDGRGADPDRPARRGAESVLEFEDFADLDDTALARIFRAADPQVALLALCGAGRDLVDRLLGRLPLREARALRRQIEELGPTRLRDIESAQRRLAEVARRMADEGQIQVPKDRRFTGAA